jgi:hypothetical protein
MITKFINLICTTFGFILFIIVALIGYLNATRSLSDYENVESNVIEKGISKSDRNSQVFFFRIYNVNENFIVYRMTQNYADLDKAIKIGEKIKVYYQPFNGAKKYNLDVMQVEKGKQVVLKHNEHQLKYLAMMLLGTMAAIYTLYIGFCIIKYGKFDDIIPPIF